MNRIINSQEFSNYFSGLKRKTLEAYYDRLEFEINSKRLKKNKNQSFNIIIFK